MLVDGAFDRQFRPTEVQVELQSASRVDHRSHRVGRSHSSSSEIASFNARLNGADVGERLPRRAQHHYSRESNKRRARSSTSFRLTEILPRSPAFDAATMMIRSSGYANSVALCPKSSVPRVHTRVLPCGVVVMNQP